MWIYSHELFRAIALSPLLYVSIRKVIREGILTSPMLQPLNKTSYHTIFVSGFAIEGRYDIVSGIAYKLALVISIHTSREKLDHIYGFFFSRRQITNTKLTNTIKMFCLQILFLLISTISAYTVLPQRASYFVGRDVNTQQQQQSRNNGSTIEMKKGKANVSPQMRQQYKRAQEMEGYRQQMIDSQTAGADGFPVFNLFVRTPLKNVSCCCVVCCL